MTAKTALLQGTRLLEDGGVIAPRLTAEVLLGARARPPARIPVRLSRTRTQLKWSGCTTAATCTSACRANRRSTSPKRQEFWGREFRVTPDVLIPRPETEHVVEAALRAARGARRVLDVGTGSGALAVTLALEMGAESLGTDISTAALEVAADNARRLEAPTRFAACDLMSAVAPQSMDLIVSNPPYVPLRHAEGLQREVRDWEPGVALFGGVDGFDFYDRIAAAAPRVLRRGGWLIMELGFATHEHVAGLFRNGWEDVELAPDLAGIPRVIAARLL